MDDRYRPLSTRRRILILLLAITTAITVALTLLDPPGGVQRTRVAPTPAASCAGGNDVHCVGGKADAYVVSPVAAPASAGQ